MECLEANLISVEPLRGNFPSTFLWQQTKSHTAELRAKPEYHKFLIGKGGGNIRKVRDSTGARIIFPTAEDKDQELITVIGTEEAVQEAQKELEELIKSLVRIPTTAFEAPLLLLQQTSSTYFIFILLSCRKTSLKTP